MTVAEYIAQGFEISLHLDQSIVDRAERDVRAAYITPLYPVIADETEPAEVTDAVYNLAFLLMLQRNVFATRSGAKLKQTNDSRDAERSDVLRQCAYTCAQKLEAVRQLPGAVAGAKVTDICRIYLKTNYFNL